MSAWYMPKRLLMESFCVCTNQDNQDNQGSRNIIGV